MSIYTIQGFDSSTIRVRDLGLFVKVKVILNALYSILYKVPLHHVSVSR